MKRALILHDALPPGAGPEALDVLAQARVVEAGLRACGWAAARLAVTPDLAALAVRLRRSAPGLIFNLVESLGGRDERITWVPMLLESLDLTFTGAPAMALQRTTGKTLAKGMLRAAGLPTPDWIEGGVGRFAPGRWIVKPVWTHGSAGLDDGAVGRFATRRALLAAVEARGRGPAGECFAERFIEGREFNLSLLDGPRGPQVLPPAEIRFDRFPRGKPRIVGYAAKWNAGSFEEVATPRTFDFSAGDRALLARLRSLAAAAWRAFGLRGWARVDFRVDRRGRPWILEVNANPCLAPDAGFLAAAARAGIGADAAVARIVASAGQNRHGGGAGAARDFRQSCGGSR